MRAFVFSVLFASLFLNQTSQAALTGTDVPIFLRNQDLPASDLSYNDHGQLRILSPREAWQLKKRWGVDLSKLDPDTSTDVWKKEPTTSDSKLDQALPIQKGDSA